MKYTSSNIFFTSILDQNLIDKGRKIVYEKKIKFKNYSSIDISGKIIWHHVPDNNRSNQWMLNWFAFIPSMLSYYHHTKDGNALIMIESLLTDWLDKHLTTKSIIDNEFGWHDHATALRAEMTWFNGFTLPS